MLMEMWTLEFQFVRFQGGGGVKNCYHDFAQGHLCDIMTKNLTLFCSCHMTLSEIGGKANKEINKNDNGLILLRQSL